MIFGTYPPSATCDCWYFNLIPTTTQITGCTFRGLDCLTTIDSDDEDSFIMDYEVFFWKCFQHWSWLIKGSVESDLRKLLQHFRRRWVFWQILTDWSQLWTQSWVTGSNNQNAASFIQSETRKAKKGQISRTWRTYNQSLNSAQVLEDDFLGDHDQYRILARCRKTTTWEVGKQSPLAFESPSR